MSDLTKYAKGRRMPFEQDIRKIYENAKKILDLQADLGTKSTIYEVSNITSINKSILNEIKAGDLVRKKTGNQKHTYVVTYKEDNVGICLTYIDASTVETVSYDRSGSTWVYNSTDKYDFDKSKVVANPTLAGTEALLTALEINNTKYKIDVANKVKVYTGASLTDEIVGQMQLGDVFRPTEEAGTASYSLTLVKYDKGDQADDYKVFAQYEDTTSPTAECGQITFVKWKDPYVDDSYTGWEYYDSFEYKLGYDLPKASASTLGGVKVGSGLSIDSDGVLSASGGSQHLYCHNIYLSSSFGVGGVNFMFRFIVYSTSDTATNVTGLRQFLTDNTGSYYVPMSKNFSGATGFAYINTCYINSSNNIEAQIIDASGNASFQTGAFTVSDTVTTII